MAKADDFMTMSMREAHMLDLAARGDAEAQMRLAQYCLDAAERDADFVSEAFPMAEMAARMASAHGARETRLFLSEVLNARACHFMKVGEIEMMAKYQAESLAILNELADQGDQEAEQLLLDQVETTIPEIVAIARRMRRKATSGMANAATPFCVTASELRSLKG